MRCSDDQLYGLEATTALIPEESFSLAHQLFSTVSTAVGAFKKNFVEGNFTAMLFAKLHGRPAEGDRKYTTIFEGRGTRLGTRFGEHKVHQQGKGVSHFGTTYSAEKSTFDSKSDFAAVLFPPRVKNRPVVSSLVCLDTCMAALEQAPRR